MADVPTAAGGEGAVGVAGNPFGDDNSDSGRSSDAGSVGSGGRFGDLRDRRGYDDDDDADKADFMLPDAVKEYLLDFHDAVKGGRLHEITRFYDAEWKQQTERYFQATPWPSVDDVEYLVDDDPVFLVLYRLLYYKHVMAYLPSKKIKSKLIDHVEAWDTYRDFFDIVMDAEYSDVSLPPQWLYEILSEFIYQFQNFLQLRSKPAALDEEERDMLRDEYSDVWGIVDVLQYLHRLVDESDIRELLTSTGKDLPTEMLQQLGYFALVCLCRLHCQLGDYSLALRMVQPMNLTNDSLFSKVPACHITLFYYMGFALLMSRRYVDALQCFSRTLLYFNRTKNAQSGDVLRKRSDQMMSLLAICHVLCPGKRMDDQVFKLMKRTHEDKIKRMSGRVGAIDAFLEVFKYASPTFISACADLAADIEACNNEVLQNQLALFKKEVTNRVENLPTVRSYLQLYTNIDTTKLGRFCAASAEDTHTSLVALKLNMYQNQGGVGSDAPSAWTSADPLHFFVDNDTVHIDEGVAVSKSSKYFANQIRKFDKVMGVVSRAGVAKNKQRGYHKHKKKEGGDKKSSRDAPRRERNMLNRDGTRGRW